MKGKGLGKLFPQLCRGEDCLGQGKNSEGLLEFLLFHNIPVVKVYFPSNRMQNNSMCNSSNGFLTTAQKIALCFLISEGKSK